MVRPEHAAEKENLQGKLMQGMFRSEKQHSAGHERSKPPDE